MIRYVKGYRDYNEYTTHQLRKTTSDKIVKRESDNFAENVEEFKRVFAPYVSEYDIKTAMCAGARMGAEVRALQDLGVRAIGIDLVDCQPYVIAGDIHDMPFPDDAFAMVYTNVFDHSLRPDVFASEIQRVSKPGALVLMHLAVGTSTDSYRAIDLDSAEDIMDLFSGAEALCRKPYEGRGSINTEVALWLR